MQSLFATAYTLLIDAVVQRRVEAAGSPHAGVYDPAAGMHSAAAAYRFISGVIAVVERMLDKRRFRSAAFADRMARPAGRAA